MPPSFLFLYLEKHMKIALHLLNDVINTNTANEMINLGGNIVNHLSIAFGGIGQVTNDILIDAIISNLRNSNVLASCHVAPITVGIATTLIKHDEIDPTQDVEEYIINIASVLDQLYNNKYNTLDSEYKEHDQFKIKNLRGNSEWQ